MCGRQRASLSLDWESACPYQQQLGKKSERSSDSTHSKLADLDMRSALMLPLLIIVTACGNGGAAPGSPRNGSISRALHQGMTEREVVAVSSPRVPDRIIVTKCGTKTQHPFDCRAYVFEGGLRAGQYDSKLTVLFEKSGGQWLVGQWY